MLYPSDSSFFITSLSLTASKKISVFQDPQDQIYNNPDNAKESPHRKVLNLNSICKVPFVMYHSHRFQGLGRGHLLEEGMFLHSNRNALIIFTSVLFFFFPKIMRIPNFQKDFFIYFFPSVFYSTPTSAWCILGTAIMIVSNLVTVTTN